MSIVKTKEKLTINDEVENLDILEELKKQLRQANIKIILPKKSEEKRNNRLNVYISEAEEFDGKQRICYLTIEDSYIEIQEFKGSRGDRYSGFYKLLCSFLLKKNIQYTLNDKKLKLDISYFNELIEVFESLSKIYSDGKCRLTDTKNTFIKKLKGEEQECKIQYYEIADSKIDTKKQEELPFYEEMKKVIDNAGRLLLEGTGDEFVKTYEALQAIKEYIGVILNDSEKRKAGLEKIREIQI